MHVTIHIRVDGLSDPQTLACLKDAFTDAVPIEQASEDSSVLNTGQKSASTIKYACRPTNESIALFSMPGGGRIECVLEFAYSSNETLPALTEDTVKIIERQVERSAGKFHFLKARLEDISSLGTAVEGTPVPWTNRVRTHVAQRDLLNKILVVAALAGLGSFMSDLRTGAVFAGIGVAVSVAVSLAQATWEPPKIEWRIR
ncbi:MAG: hypothetical protein OXE02_12945 [Chloroflexi bacterium]|nr:hypothetical protein [Chloroflexota bacterium]